MALMHTMKLKDINMDSNDVADMYEEQLERLEILVRLSGHYFGEYFLKDMKKYRFNDNDIIIKPDYEDRISDGVWVVDDKRIEEGRLFLNLDNTIEFNLPFNYSGIDVFKYPLGEVIEPLSTMPSYHITWDKFEDAVESHPDL